MVEENLTSGLTEANLDYWMDLDYWIATCQLVTYCLALG